MKELKLSHLEGLHKCVAGPELQSAPSALAFIGVDTDGQKGCSQGVVPPHLNALSLDPAVDCSGMQRIEGHTEQAIGQPCNAEHCLQHHMSCQEDREYEDSAGNLLMLCLTHVWQNPVGSISSLAIHLCKALSMVILTFWIN